MSSLSQQDDTYFHLILRIAMSVLLKVFFLFLHFQVLTYQYIVYYPRSGAQYPFSYC